MVIARRPLGNRKWEVFERRTKTVLGVFTEGSGFTPSEDQYLMKAVEAPARLKRMDEWTAIRIRLQGQGESMVLGNDGSQTA